MGKKFLTTLMGVSLLSVPTLANSQVKVEWFDYQGQDRIFNQPLQNDQYFNPVLPGFFPDPSITRKGDDYYLAVSSFTYTPGLPILHSKDLVNWQLVGHALNGDAGIDFNGLRLSRGIFAPTLRYHDGVFYLITTAVDSGGNFIMTADDPAGPWSKPIWLPEVGGIDPDLFFDNDGRVYIAHNDAPPGTPLYDGHRAVWMWEYDPNAQKVVAGSRKLLVNGGVDISTKPVWIEGPHLYHIDGWYYLICAEGGTSVNHSVVVFRTRSLDQPFVPYQGNPILTQRDLSFPQNTLVTSTGHADLVQTQNGHWWSVFLATRPYRDNYYNTGRETFLLPVSWDNGWPHYIKPHTAVPIIHSKPSLPPGPVQQPLSGNLHWRDEFNQPTLGKDWQTIKGFDRSWLTIQDGQLTLQAGSEPLTSLKQPALVLRRQQHQVFTASAQLQLPEDNVKAGIVAYQNEHYYYSLAIKSHQQQWVVELQMTAGGEPQTLASLPLTAPVPQAIELKIEGNRDKISFMAKDTQWHTVAQELDATNLSTEAAGGFVGAMVGVFAVQEK